MALASVLIARGDITLAPPDKKKADKREQPAPPPRAVPAGAKVARGGSVEIVLRAAGGGLMPVKFLIRAQPQSGKLSGLRSTGADAAVITYRHGGGVAAARDRFQFAVQGEQGVSAPVDVDIAIAMEPPMLGVPAEIDFGTARVGDTTGREIAIENRGVTPARGALATDSPWSVSGDAGYDLAPGESKKFALVFAPPTGDEFRGAIRYGSGVGQTTTLLGKADAPFAVKPARVGLTARGLSRTGTFTIVNRTHDRQTLLLRTDVRLHAPERIELPADGEAGVTIEATNAQRGAFDDEVLIGVGGYTTRVAVRAPPVGALLRVTPESLSFGSVPLKKNASLPVRVENIGGASASVVVAIPSPFRVADGDMLFSLLAGESRELRVWVDASRQGRAEAGLVLNFTGGTVTVPVRAAFVAGTPPREVPSAPQSSAPPPAPERANPVQPPPVSTGKISHPRLKQVTQTGGGIEWSGPDGGQFRIEERLLFLENDRVRIEWSPATDATIATSGTAGTAHFSKLVAGQRYTVRVVLLGANGEPVETSVPVEIPTVAKRRLSLSAGRFLMIALVVVVALAIRQRFRKTAD